jgi:hypothetical protein
MRFFDIFKEYKVFNKNLSSHVNVPLWNAFTNPANTCTLFVEIWRNVQGSVEHWINKGMQKHPSIDKCGVLALVECFAWMGKVQHFVWN